MPVIKTEQKTDYASIPNSTCRDPNIDKFSLGVLVTLVSMPSNWIIHKKFLQKECGCGRDKMDTTFKVLQKNNYLVKVPFRINGKFTNDVWIAFADSETGSKYANDQDALIELMEDNMPVKLWDPLLKEKIDNPYVTLATPAFQPSTENPLTVDSPFTENPLTEKPSTVNPQLLKKENKDKEEPALKKKNTTTTSSTGVVKISLSEFFETVRDQMKGSGVPEWFISFKASDLWFRYEHPCVGSALQICYNDWTKMDDVQKRNARSVMRPVEQDTTAEIDFA